MAGKFKVWVSVEYVDDELGVYEDVSAFPVCAGTFDYAKEADAFVEELTGESTHAYSPEEDEVDPYSCPECGSRADEACARGCTVTLESACLHERQHVNDRSQFVCDGCGEELGR